jgi:hypothetical protein
MIEKREDKSRKDYAVEEEVKPAGLACRGHSSNKTNGVTAVKIVPTTAQIQPTLGL